MSRPAEGRRFRSRDGSRRAIPLRRPDRRADPGDPPVTGVDRALRRAAAAHRFRAPRHAEGRPEIGPLRSVGRVLDAEIAGGRAAAQRDVGGVGEADRARQAEVEMHDDVGVGRADRRAGLQPVRRVPVMGAGGLAAVRRRRGDAVRQPLDGGLQPADEAQARPPRHAAGRQDEHVAQQGGAVVEGRQVAAAEQLRRDFAGGEIGLAEALPGHGRARIAAGRAHRSACRP